MARILKVIFLPLIIRESSDSLYILLIFFGFITLGTEQLAKKMQINENKLINLIPLMIDFKDVKYLKFI